jgi:hypothetical protein
MVRSKESPIQYTIKIALSRPPLRSLTREVHIGVLNIPHCELVIKCPTVIGKGSMTAANDRRISSFYVD